MTSARVDLPTSIWETTPASVMALVPAETQALITRRTDMVRSLSHVVMVRSRSSASKVYVPGPAPRTRFQAPTAAGGTLPVAAAIA